MYCKECATDMGEGARFCSTCGASQARPAGPVRAFAALLQVFTRVVGLWVRIARSLAPKLQHVWNHIVPGAMRLAERIRLVILRVAEEMEKQVRVAVDRFRKETGSAVFCTQCGGRLTRDQRYCSTCGASQESQDAGPIGGAVTL